MSESNQGRAAVGDVLIDVNGIGQGRVLIGGVEVKGVRGVKARIEANTAPEVTLSMAIRERAQIKCDGATLVIDDVVMPLEIEIALWRHLMTKYNLDLNVTTIGSTSVEHAMLMELATAKSSSQDFSRRLSERDPQIPDPRISSS